MSHFCMYDKNMKDCIRQGLSREFGADAATEDANLNLAATALKMRRVYVYHVDGECLVRMSAIDTPSTRGWSCALNNNYIDDVNKIHAAIAKLPSRVDVDGDNWVRCNFDALKCIILKIVAACVMVRVPMIFTPQWVRRTMITLGCCQVLPRDLLRVVAEHMPGDAALIEMFDKYKDLKCIKGLYIRMNYGGVWGPRVSVRRVQLQLRAKGWRQYQIILRNGAQFTNDLYYKSVEHLAYFCIHMSSIQADPELQLIFVVRFEADAEIKFVHKQLDKYNLI